MSALPIFTILKNGETIRTQSLEGDGVIGREEGCVIRLEDRAISRQHAILRRTSEGVQIEKKSEFAPLSVNGAECTRADLKEGDVIAIGPYLMKLSLQGQGQGSQPQKAVAPPVQEPAQPLASAPVLVAVPTVDPIFPDLGSDIGPGEGSPEPAMNLESLVAEEIIPDFGGLEGISDNSNSNVSMELDLNQPTPSLDSSEPVSDDGKTKILSSPVQVKLFFKPGAANHEEYDAVKDEITIGRGKDCDIILNDKKASRVNTTIHRVGMKFVLKDLDSSNGTFLNGKKITEQELSGDDRIKIGDVEFQFRAVSGDYQAKEKDFMPVPEEPPEGFLPDFTPEPVEEPAMAGGFESPQSPDPLQGVTGISGIEQGPQKTGLAGLYDKNIRNFSKLEPKRKITVALIVVCFLSYMLIDDPSPAKKKSPKAKPVATASPVPGAPGLTAGQSKAALGALTPEQLKFVEAQHDLAFDHYKNKDYDKALYEIRKIFPLVADFKDSKEIERYAVEGKRKTEALEEEKHKKEEEARLKTRINDLVEETRGLMEKKHFEQASELFSQILALDPDNQQIGQWKKTIDDFRVAKRMEEQREQLKAEVNHRGGDFFTQGMIQRKQGHYHGAIASFHKVVEVGSTDPVLVKKSKLMIQVCLRKIAETREPILEKAKQLEASGDLAGAYQEFKHATQVDPNHPAGFAGMGRLNGILHQKAKGLYTEAVLAESYSDFAMAQKKYQECFATSPDGDIYHERAQRKLANYFRKDEATQ